MSALSCSSVPIKKLANGSFAESDDVLASEEPLEIRINGKAISVTMRTPGNDEELALGFLFTEGIIKDRNEIKALNTIGNVTDVILHDNIKPELKSLERNFYTSSSCGVCGKSSVDALRTVSIYSGLGDELRIAASHLLSLPTRLREKQDIFQKTGGLHASALFDAKGELIALREDVGRHNALDKLLGYAFMHGLLPLNRQILLLSGRASFELVQKAAMAGIRIIAAVGAPSSLAVETAREFNISLAGFLREDRFNLYSASHRISEQ